MDSYYGKIFCIALRDPLKLRGLFRLRTGGEHRIGKYYKCKDGISAPPITVAVRPTYRCNLRCIQCGQWGDRGVFRDVFPNEMIKDELPTEEMKRFIKEIARFNPYVYFTGGEPLLRNDIFELIEFASKQHLLTSVSSNAILLSDRAQEAIDSGLDYFYSSLDAPDCLNNDIRRGEDSFNKAAEGIKKLVALRNKTAFGLPIVQVQTIIVQENHDKLYEMARFVNDELGADVWGLQLRVFASKEANKKAEEIYRREFGVDSKYWRGFVMESTTGFDYKALEEEIKRIVSRKWRFRLRLYKPLGFPKFTFEKYFERPEELLVDPPCMYPWAFAQIQPNGDVALCGSQPDYVIGNIGKNSFNEIWNGEKAIKFRKYIQESLLPVCPRCFGFHIFSGYK